MRTGTMVMTILRNPRYMIGYSMGQRKREKNPSILTNFGCLYLLQEQAKVLS